jgi:hypothetical protein
VACGCFDRTRSRVIEHCLIERIFTSGDDATYCTVAGDVDRGAHHVEQAVGADDEREPSKCSSSGQVTNICTTSAAVSVRK